MLRCEDNSIYTGITKNLESRTQKHLIGKGAKYTAIHKPKNILACWKCEDKSLALKLEYRIKRLSKAIKENLAKGEITLEEQFKEIIDVSNCDRVDEKETKLLEKIVFIDF